MDEILIPLVAIVALFIVFPGMIFHYITLWRKQKTLMPDDERMMEDLWRSARAMERRIEQELTRKETWPSSAQYGNKLAEARESRLSSAARLETASMELRARLDTATQPAPAAGASAGVANGGGGRLAELNASNAALQGRVDAAKQRLRALEQASGKQIDELLSTAGGGAPAAAASSARARVTAANPSADAMEGIKRSSRIISEIAGLPRSKKAQAHAARHRAK